MITSNDYIRWYENKKKEMLNSSMFGSEPTFLFTRTDDWEYDMVFNPKNWNGGDILRRGLLKLLDERRNVEPYEIKYFCIEEQTTIFLFAATKWYEISWYKNRGCTESIKMNGEPIYLEDYIDLCNSLGISLD